MDAIAYHLTWTTYGSWLPGDGRGWITSGRPGIQDPDPAREEAAREQMAEDEGTLDEEQRRIVEQTIRDHCRLRGWTLYAVNVRSNHVHVVVAAHRDAADVMNQLKAWSSRRLSDHAGLTTPVARKAGRRRWWTEGGGVKRIRDEDYLREAIAYVLERQ